AQSGVALALEDLLRLLLKSQDTFFVFGSFCDGWGSCLSKIDGSIDSDSDIDITFVLKSNSVHIPADCSASETSNCLKGCKVADYEDGHVCYASKEPSPCLSFNGATFRLPEIEAISARHCCSYPRIELLSPGYRSHISTQTLEAIRTEVLQVPRCHAVSASPPGLEGSRMRLFVLLKFFIKRHISSKVSGLKTYMAKNLLFYMLDET
uniref:NTP_transf_2 domain-containing protein n=1 Tax=Macrostomum lignano TaxID=282301 RepID=A0A1I8IFP4_9PLAT